MQSQIDNTINLIAAESMAYPEVKKLLSSDLMDKRIEGLPGNRWYSGCKLADDIENSAIDRVTKLFNYRFANVQPYSGSLANFAAYLALLEPGDCVLSLALRAGGHVSHGATACFVSKLFEFNHYNLNQKMEIDYDEVQQLADRCLPKLIIGDILKSCVWIKNSQRK